MRRARDDGIVARGSPESRPGLNGGTLISGFDEILAETTRRLGHVEGEIKNVREQLASSLATEAQLRRELGECRMELVRAEAELEHAQIRMQDHEVFMDRLVSELEDRLTEARRTQDDAERERALVIDALGQRARSRLTKLGRTDEPRHPRPESEEG